MENTNNGKNLPKPKKSELHRNGNPPSPSGMKNARNTGKHGAGTNYLRQHANKIESNGND